MTQLTGKGNEWAAEAAEISARKKSIIGILSNDTAGFELPIRKSGVADECH